MIGICLFFLSTFAVVSVGESKTKEMTLVVNPVQPVLNPPTFKSNKSFSKTSEDAKKVEVCVDMSFQWTIYSNFLPKVLRFGQTTLPVLNFAVI